LESSNGHAASKADEPVIHFKELSQPVWSTDKPNIQQPPAIILSKLPKKIMLVSSNNSSNGYKREDTKEKIYAQSFSKPPGTSMPLPSPVYQEKLPKQSIRCFYTCNITHAMYPRNVFRKSTKKYTDKIVKLTVAYSRPRNLRDALMSSTLHETPEEDVKRIMRKMRTVNRHNHMKVAFH